MEDQFSTNTSSKIAKIEKILFDHESQYINENKILLEKLEESKFKESQYKLQLMSLQNKIEEISNEKSKTLNKTNITLENEYQKNKFILKSYNDLLFSFEENEKKNSELQNIINEMNSNYNDLNSKYNIIKENNENFYNSNNELLQKNKNLNTELETLKTKYNELNDKYMNLYNNYNNLSKENYNKEEKLLNEIKDKENIIQKLKENEANFQINNKEIIYKKMNELSDEIIFTKLQYSNLLADCNKNIDIIVDWAEKNIFMDINNKEIKTPDIKINISNAVEFSKIKNILIKIKNILDNSMNNKYSSNKKIYLIYNKLISEINKEKYFEIDNKNEIEEIIDRLLLFLKEIKNNPSVYMKKLIEDNTMLNKENKSLRSKAMDLLNDNKILTNNYKKLLEDNNKLKKNLNIDNKTENKTKNKIENNKDNEKEQLIKDNIILYKQIKKLKNKIKDSSFQKENETV